MSPNLNFFISKPYRLVQTEIVSASRQVVSGTLYRVIVKMEESTCKNTDLNNKKGVAACPSRNGLSQTCKFTILSRPWLKEFGKDLKITATHCR